MPATNVYPWLKHSNKMEQMEHLFSFNLIILGKVAVYFFLLSIAFFVFSTRNPIKKIDDSRRESKTATLASSTSSTASESDSPRSCATVKLSPEAKCARKLHAQQSDF
jgi:hypothetical protein